MLVLFYPVLDWKYPFWVYFFPKNQNGQFQSEFGTKLI